MYINDIKLLNFRNYENLNIKLTKGINIFKGKNAQGKTNFLESIYLCAIGKSYRTLKYDELIKWDVDNCFIELNINKNKRTENIKFYIDNIKKGIKINNITIYKLSDLIGYIKIVNFVPEDLNLFKNGPSKRRKFLNLQISQIDRLYFENLQKYYRVIKQRNNVLKHINVSRETLEIWNKQLIEYGSFIIKKRFEMIEGLNNTIKVIHKELTNNKEEIKIVYNPNTTIANYNNNLINAFEKEKKYKYTYVGPHKDDFSIMINNKDIKKYASQGQQRTAILSLKFSEIEIYKKEKNDAPILLLDDVLSELDVNRRFYILKYIKNIQTIITCTDVDQDFKKLLHEKQIYNVNNGQIYINKE